MNGIKNMILNDIKICDFEWHWNLWFWMVFKDMILNGIKNMILNVIKRYNFEWYKKYDFEFYRKIYFWMKLKDIILNSIQWCDFEFHSMIWFKRN